MVSQVPDRVRNYAEGKLERANISAPQDLLRVADRYVRQQFARSSHKRLAAEKGRQREAFEKLVPEFEPLYRRLESYSPDEYRTDLWNGFLGPVVKSLSPTPPFAFQADPVIMRTMVVRARRQVQSVELQFLENTFDEDLRRRLLAEDYAGDPLLLPGKYETSPNTVHHVYHIARYLADPKRSLEGVTSVVEWGGGFGNQGKLCRRLLGEDLTYTIIDLPIFTALQWLYLSSIYGRDAVHVASDDDMSTVPGKFNLLAVGLLDRASLSCDLFLSTFALNESSVAAQVEVEKRNWFGASRLLLALGPEEPLTSMLRTAGAQIEPLGHILRRFYTFR